MAESRVPLVITEEVTLTQDQRVALFHGKPIEIEVRVTEVPARAETMKVRILTAKDE